MLRPIKKKGGRPGEKVPIIIAEGDGSGNDTFMHLKNLVEIDPVPDAKKASTPLFRIGQEPMRVNDVRRLAKKIMKAAGQAGAPVGAHSFRIGGATDLADRGASPLLLQAKGRWASDIGRIYARMTRRSQMAASRLMQQRGGEDMEELFPGFTQPA